MHGISVSVINTDRSNKIDEQIEERYDVNEAIKHDSNEVHHQKGYHQHGLFEFTGNDQKTVQKKSSDGNSKLKVHSIYGRTYDGDNTGDNSDDSND